MSFLPSLSNHCLAEEELYLLQSLCNVLRGITSSMHSGCAMITTNKYYHYLSYKYVSFYMNE